MNEDRIISFKDLKSLPSNLISLVRFVSRTRRKVSIKWIDYDGNYVSYGNIYYSQDLKINTFPTHPWIFRDAITNDELVTNKGLSVYWPKIWDGEGDSDIVIIGIPVYSLHNCCIQAVRKLFSPSQIKLLKIPGELIYDLTTITDEKENRIVVNIIA